MDVLSAAKPMGPEMYALKQSTQVQEEIITKLVDTLQDQMQTSTAPVSGLADQGIGANLDIKG